MHFYFRNILYFLHEISEIFMELYIFYYSLNVREFWIFVKEVQKEVE